MNGLSMKGRPAMAAGVSHAEHGIHPSETAFSDQMHRQMQLMMRAMDAAPMSGDPDRDFLAMMIPHHQGAVDMAQLVLLHGQDPLVRQLADEIIASQRSEIASMTAQDWRFFRDAGSRRLTISQHIRGQEDGRSHCRADFEVWATIEKLTGRARRESCGSITTGEGTGWLT
jgi:hypothetical protein